MLLVTSEEDMVQDQLGWGTYVVVPPTGYTTVG